MVNPVKINPRERFSRAWQPARRVWYQKNEDGNAERQEKIRNAKERLDNIKSRAAKDNYIRKMIKEEEIYL